MDEIKLLQLALAAVQFFPQAYALLTQASADGKLTNQSEVDEAIANAKAVTLADVAAADAALDAAAKT